MPRPEIVLENYESLYSYYADLEPSTLALKAAHRISSAVYRPRTSFENGAENNIADSLSSGSRLLIACNHLNMFDQFPVAAAIQRSDVLHPIIGNTFVPGKAPYFQKFYLRLFLDALGSVPVFRRQDVGDDFRLHAAATKTFIDLCVKKVEDGHHMFIFPEGTRNRDDPTHLGLVSKGIGRIACGVSENVNVDILPMGLWFGKNPKGVDWIKPGLFIGDLIRGPFEEYKDATLPLTTALSDCIGKAMQIRYD